MKPHKTYIKELIVLPEGEPIFSELATTVGLQDEAAGLFVVVTQVVQETGSIAITPEEWPAVRDAIDQQIALITAINKNATVQTISPQSEAKTSGDDNV